jgi:hypothetical protein
MKSDLGGPALMQINRTLRLLRNSPAQRKVPRAISEVLLPAGRFCWKHHE